MAKSGISEETFINSIVGPGTFVRGHIELQGLLRIDGDFSGSVRTEGRVIVGRTGRADCAIEAGTVVIGGLFRGEILAFEKVVLLSSSVVLGTVAAPRLVVEEGVLFSGRFRVTGSKENLLGETNRAERQKALLIESVQQRERSAAVRGASVAASRGRERVTENEPVPAVSGRRDSGESESWNG